MGRSCTVCESPERDEIDVELAGGRSRRAVATEYRRTESAVRRHASGHLEPGLHRVSQMRESLRLGSMVERLVLLSDQTNAILNEAISVGGNRRVALSAIKEARELVGLIGRLTGPDAAETIEEARQLVGALARVLPRHLIAATDLAEELRGTGSRELAEAILEMVATQRDATLVRSFGG